MLTLPTSKITTLLLTKLLKKKKTKKYLFARTIPASLSQQWLQREVVDTKTSTVPTRVTIPTVR